jgi:hypothetical protein
MCRQPFKLREDIHGQNASLVDEPAEEADGSEDDWPEMRMQQSEDMSVVTLG